MKTSNKQKHEIKLSKRFENNGFDCEEESGKNKKLNIFCEEHDKLNWKNVHIETGHDVLVE